MRSPVHSPWLPGCVDVKQTVLVIVTMPDFSLIYGADISNINLEEKYFYILFFLIFYCSITVIPIFPPLLSPALGTNPLSHKGKGTSSHCNLPNA